MDYNKLILGTFSLKRLITSILTIYIFFTIFAYLYAEKLIFPYKQSSYDKNILGLKMLNSHDGTKIATRFWQAKDEQALILFFHGNYMDIGHLDDVAEILQRNNYSTLAMDYRGYGLSQSTPTEANSYADAQMIYDYALKLGYTAKNIIILGQSVGSGIATELSLHNQAKSLVLISPFVSTYRVMTKYPIILFDKFNNLSKINKIALPLFIVHGDNDEIIPAWHSEKLINQHKTKHKRILIKGAGHNDIWQYADKNFITQLFK